LSAEEKRRVYCFDEATYDKQALRGKVKDEKG
jgi:hypothetical protein